MMHVNNAAMSGPIRRLVDALGLKYCTELVLRMKVGQLVEITATGYATGDQVDTIADFLETREFILVHKDDLK